MKPSTEIVILVIVRWNDPESRQFLRNILQKYTGGLKIQLMFVFGYPNVASVFQIDRIWRESLTNQDLIVPRKFSCNNCHFQNCQKIYTSFQMFKIITKQWL